MSLSGTKKTRLFNVSHTAKLLEFLIMAKNSIENPYVILRSGQNVMISVSVVTFHRDKNKHSLKSKTMGSVTSPKTVLTLFW